MLAVNAIADQHSSGAMFLSCLGTATLHNMAAIQKTPLDETKHTSSHSMYGHADPSIKALPLLLHLMLHHIHDQYMPRTEPTGLKRYLKKFFIGPNASSEPWPVMPSHKRQHTYMYTLTAITTKRGYPKPLLPNKMKAPCRASEPLHQNCTHKAHILALSRHCQLRFHLCTCLLYGTGWHACMLRMLRSSQDTRQSRSVKAVPGNTSIYIDCC